MSTANEDNGGNKNIRKMKEKEPWPLFKKAIDFHAAKRMLTGTKQGVIAIDVIQQGIEPNYPEIAAEALMLGTENWTNAANQDKLMRVWWIPMRTRT